MKIVETHWSPGGRRTERLLRDYSVVLKFGDWENIEKKRGRKAGVRAGRREVVQINWMLPLSTHRYVDLE